MAYGFTGVMMGSVMKVSKTGEPSLYLKVERKDISGWKISEN